MKKHLDLIFTIISPVVIFWLIDSIILKGKYEQVPIIVAFITMIVLIAIVLNVEKYTHILLLKEYWLAESNKEIKYIKDDFTSTKNSINSTASKLLSNSSVNTLSKVKYCITDSSQYIKSLKDNMIWIVMVNLFMLMLMYLIYEGKLPTIPKESLLVDKVMKKVWGWASVVLQIAFIAGQFMVHKNRNNRLNTEITALNASQTEKI